MTLIIPPRPITGSALKAAWGELQDTDISDAAARCGYVDEMGCPDIERFKQAVFNETNDRTLRTQERTGLIRS